MIVSCEHNNGGMGLCSECSAESHRSVERTSAAVRKQNELEQAASIADRYGCYDAARQLRQAMLR